MKCKHNWIFYKMEYHDAWEGFVKERKLEVGYYAVLFCSSCGEVKRVKLRGY